MTQAGTKTEHDGTVARRAADRLTAKVAHLRRAIAGVVGGVLVAATLAVPAGAQAPNPPPQAPPGLGPTVDKFLGWLKWGGLIAGVVGLGICGIMMMVGRRNRSSTAVDGASGIPWVLGGLTVMSFAASITSAVLA